MQSPSRFDQATAVAQRRVLVAGVVVAVVVGAVLALTLSIVLGLLVLLAGIAGWVLWARALLAGVLDRTVAQTGARPADPAEVPSWFNALEGVAILTGVQVPELYLLDTPAANALCAADGGAAAVVVTSGLLDGAGPVELEVLAAELLCRLRDGSARYATLAAGLPPWLEPVAGTGGAAMAAVLGDQRAARADLDAVGVTKYPPALISALDRMEQAGTSVPVAAARSAALWVAPAVGPEGVDPAVQQTANQPLDYRIAALREL